MHDLRKRFITLTLAATHSIDQTAEAIGIDPRTARRHYLDAKRAIDYLVSRPDVDPDRIGTTGCSGGGAITTYVGVFEPRVKAAAPGCFINSFRTLFSGNTADSEMSFPTFLASGLDIADFFEVAAPLPWLMMATTEVARIPETVLSRSQVFEFKTISSRQIADQLRRIADAEKVVRRGYKALKFDPFQDVSEELGWRPRRIWQREEIEVSTKGRHDPCVGIRAVPIGEAMLAIVLADHYLRHRAQMGG